MTVKDYLLRIRQIDTLIKNNLADIKKWELTMLELATSTTAPIGNERVQASGNKQRMADAIDSGTDRIARIRKHIAELEAERDSIISTIEQLPEDKYDILHKVYVQYMTLKEVAASRHESYSAVTTNHGIALKLVSDKIK